MKYRLSECPLCGENADRATTYRSCADIVRCPICELVYLRTRSDRAETLDYYQGYASRTGSHMRLPSSLEEANHSGLRREWFLDGLLKYTLPGRLLDIGGGWGGFAKATKDRGFDAQIVELCQQMAEFCRDILGITAHTKDVEEITFDEKTFQVVTILHTLEHLHDPNAALCAIRRILAPGGVFCGIVPNIESLSSETLRDAWCWLDPNNHLTHFSPRTLREHLQRRGFHILELYTQSGDYTVEHVKRAVFPGSPLPDDQMNAAIATANQNGFGEEIVFFCRR